MRAAYLLHMRESLGDLLINLQHRSPGVREGAAFCLSQMGFREAAVPISRLLKDPEPDVRKTAGSDLLSMCRVGKCEATIGPALVEALTDKTTRSDATRALVILKTTDGKEPVFSILQKDVEEDAVSLRLFSGSDIRNLAAFLGPDKAREILGLYLSRAPAVTRRSVALFLGESQDRQAAPLLFEALNDKDSEVASASIRALSDLLREIGDRRALRRLREIASLPDPPLVKTLEHSNNKSRDLEIVKCWRLH
jgi:HEAT repeat protein